MSMLHVVREGEEPPPAPRSAGAVLASRRGAHVAPRDAGFAGVGIRP